MATKISTRKFENIDMTQTAHSGPEEQELKLRVSEHGKGRRIGKDEIDVTIKKPGRPLSILGSYGTIHSSYVYGMKPTVLS